MAEKKTYRTVSDVLNMPAGEAEPLIMRAAPAIERVASAVGVFDTFFDPDYVKYQDRATFARLDEAERERITNKVLNMGKNILQQLLGKALGECLPDVMEVLAAVNGITVAQLKATYTTLEVINMAKAVIGDPGFLSFAGLSGAQAGQGLRLI